MGVGFVMVGGGVTGVGRRFAPCAHGVGVGLFKGFE